MSKIAVAGTVCIIAASAAVLAGCGSSTPAGPSALNPANRVPADAVAYASVTIRPQGSLAQEFKRAVDQLGGSGADAKLVRALTKGIETDQHDSRMFKKLLGQRIGLALVAIPSTGLRGSGLDRDLLVVIPTDNPAAARKFLAANPPKGNEAQRVVGDYLLGGGSAGVAAAAATTTADSLAASAKYVRATASIAHGQLASVYVRARPLVAAYISVLATERFPTLPSTAHVPRLERRLIAAERAEVAVEKAEFSSQDAELSAFYRRLPADAAYVVGVTLAPKTVRIDLLGPSLGETAPSPASSTGIGSLPGNSWLALKLDLKGSSKVLSSYRAAVLNTYKLQPPAGFQNSPLRFVLRDLLPALGPLSVSATGTSLTTLRAGIELTPTVASTQAALLSGAKRLLGSSLLPIKVQSTGKSVVATYGYSSLQQLLSPSSTLANTPAYKQALTQLPSGSTVSGYLNFGPVVALASLDRRAKASPVLRAVSHLSYLILGGTKTDHRIVVGFN